MLPRRWELEAVLHTRLIGREAGRQGKVQTDKQTVRRTMTTEMATLIVVPYHLYQSFGVGGEFGGVRQGVEEDLLRVVRRFPLLQVVHYPCIIEVKVIVLGGWRVRTDSPADRLPNGYGLGRLCSRPRGWVGRVG